MGWRGSGTSHSNKSPLEGAADAVQSTARYFAEHGTKVMEWHEGGTGRGKGILEFATLLGGQALFRGFIILPVTKIVQFLGKIDSHSW